MSSPSSSSTLTTDSSSSSHHGILETIHDLFLPHTTSTMSTSTSESPKQTSRSTTTSPKSPTSEPLFISTPLDCPQCLLCKHMCKCPPSQSSSPTGMSVSGMALDFDTEAGYPPPMRFR